jgi:hypothetical protein
MAEHRDQARQARRRQAFDGAANKLDHYSSPAPGQGD